MIEYPIHISGFLKGLYPSEAASYNSGLLSDCANVISDGVTLRNFGGIKSFLDIATLTTYGVDLNFPLARLFVGNGNYLISDDLWQSYQDMLVPQVVYDYVHKDNQIALSINSRWSPVAFNDFWFAVNGDCCIFRDLRSPVITEYLAVPLVDKIYRTDLIKVNCATKFRGRYLLGGFNSNLLDFDLVPDLPTKTQTYKISANAGDSFRPNTVYWSTVGGGDFFTLIDANVRMYGHTLSPIIDEDRFISRLAENFRIGTCGFTVMSWNGTVTSMAELGNSVIVYGVNGISVLNPVGKSFGVNDIATFGVMGYAAAGGKNEHIFVDPDDTLWSVSGEGLKKLGYRSHLMGQQRDRVIVYNPMADCYYISDGNFTFMLNRYGLYRTNQIVVDGVTLDQEFLCLCSEIGAELQVANFTVAPYNMQVNELKFVSSIHLSGEFDSGRVRVWYTTGQSREFKPGIWHKFNRKGVATVNTNASDFKLEFEMVGNFSISQVTAYYSMQTKLDLRGPYASAMPVS